MASVRVRRVILAFSLILVLLALAPAARAQAPTGATVPTGVTIETDAFLADTDVIVDGNVDGDLFAAGRNVTINGDVTGSLFVAAENLTLRGKVGGSMYAAAANLNLDPSAVIDHSLHALAISLLTGSGSTVTRDLNAVAFGAQLAGNVNRTTHAVIGPLEIFRLLAARIESLRGLETSWIPRGATAAATAPSGARDLASCLAPFSALGSGATGLLGRGIECLTDAPSAQEPSAQSNNSAALGEWTQNRVRELVVLFIVGVVLVLALPRRMDRWSELLTAKPVWCGLIGLLVAINGFVLIFLLTLLVALVGWFFFVVSLSSFGWLIWFAGFGLMTAAFWLFILFLFYASQAIVAYWGAAYLMNRFAPQTNLHRVLPLLLGLIVLVLLMAIPYIGALVWVAASCLGAGAVVMRLGDRLPFGRSRAAQPTAMAVAAE